MNEPISNRKVAVLSNLGLSELGFYPVGRAVFAISSVSISWPILPGMMTRNQAERAEARDYRRRWWARSRTLAWQTSQSAWSLAASLVLALSYAAVQAVLGGEVDVLNVLATIAVSTGLVGLAILIWATLQVPPMLAWEKQVEEEGEPLDTQVRVSVGKTVGSPDVLEWPTRNRRNASIDITDWYNDSRRLTAIRIFHPVEATQSRCFARDRPGHEEGPSCAKELRLGARRVRRAQHLRALGSRRAVFRSSTSARALARWLRASRLGVQPDSSTPTEIGGSSRRGVVRRSSLPPTRWGPRSCGSAPSCRAEPHR